MELTPNSEGIREQELSRAGWRTVARSTFEMTSTIPRSSPAVAGAARTKGSRRVRRRSSCSR